MISVFEAKNIINNNVIAVQPVSMTLYDAVNYILAEDITAPFDIPAFRQSSMDGYAFMFDDYFTQKKITIIGEVAAGNIKALKIEPQQAVRIFTGAPIPAGADTVVMQEKTTVQNNSLLINDEQISIGNNVRPIGSEVKAGTIFEKNSLLTPAAIGFLAGMGISTISVYPFPLVTIIITGNELQAPGIPLQFGQVYDANSFALKAALKQLQITTVNIVYAKDDLTELSNTLKTALQNSDIVLLTGGVSVGDYDFVVEAAALCGVTKLFHGVKQKPGKPLFFGTKESKLIFGLPGNPSSVLTCFYEYVVPALALLSMKKNSVSTLYLPLSKGFKKSGIFANFLKATCDTNAVSPLDAQDSYRLSSFANANCLICLAEGEKEYESGEIVEVHLLPQ